MFVRLIRLSVAKNIHKLEQLSKWKWLIEICGEDSLTDSVSIIQVKMPFLMSLKDLKNYYTVHKFNENKAMPFVIVYKGKNSMVSFKSNFHWRTIVYSVYAQTIKRIGG